MLGFSVENTPGGYSPLKMTAPLGGGCSHFGAISLLEMFNKQ